MKPWDTLAHTLRETLWLTGTKVSCDHGACGGCTVILDGKAVLSCMTLTVECDGLGVKTIEGLGDPKTGGLDPLPQAFMDHTAFQCGFCTPGILMSAKALLREKPSPEEEEVVEILTGRAKFLNDIKLPDMLYGKVLRRPHPHALIKRVNKEKTEKLPGVRPGVEGRHTPLQARARPEGQVRRRCRGARGRSKRRDRR